MGSGISADRTHHGQTHSAAGSGACRCVWLCVLRDACGSHMQMPQGRPRAAPRRVPVWQLTTPTRSNVSVRLSDARVGRKLQSNHAVGAPGMVVMTTSRCIT